MFEDHLEELCKKLNVFDYNLKVSNGSVKGDNFMSNVQRVRVYGKTKDGENAELHLIVKKASSNEILRMLYSTKSAFFHETYMYEKILPCFADLQKKYNVSNPFESYPTYYGSCKIEPKEFIVVKDVKPLGYELLHKQMTVDFKHAALILKEIGKLHALSFVLKRDCPEAFEEICDNASDIEFEPEFEMTWRDATCMFTSFALKSLDRVKDREAFNKFQDLQRNAAEAAKNAVKEASKSKHAVVAHSDCWLTNFLFKYQNNGVPSDVCILDWQLIRVGSPAYDISQVLLLCCDKKLRDEHYSDLLQEYYKSFSSFLKFFNVDASEVFPYDVMLEHLKKYSLISLLISIRVMYLISINSKDTFDLNNITSVEEAANYISGVKRNEDLFNKRTRDIILDYIKFGYEM